MKKVLLHSCCAPCSAAILEWMKQNGYVPTILFYNPNIYPEAEYLKRKAEISRYAAAIGVPIVDGDGCATSGEDADSCSANKRERDTAWQQEHLQWRACTVGLEDEPERGARCMECFKYRLLVTARYAAEHAFPMFTTSLMSSRWKSIEQIFEAGRYAQEQISGKSIFWDKNWRKGGLYERRNLLAKQFYNQQYCGCEFSIDYRLKTHNSQCPQNSDNNCKTMSGTHITDNSKIQMTS